MFEPAAWGDPSATPRLADTLIVEPASTRSGHSGFACSATPVASERSRHTGLKARQVPKACRTRMTDTAMSAPATLRPETIRQLLCGETLGAVSDPPGRI